MAPVHRDISVVPLAPPPGPEGVLAPKPVRRPWARREPPDDEAGLRQPALRRLVVLVGQINRKHYYFAVDSKNQIQGFIG
jgi:hypothetical protein